MVGDLGCRSPFRAQRVAVWMREVGFHLDDVVFSDREQCSASRFAQCAEAGNRSCCAWFITCSDHGPFLITWSVTKSIVGH
ncbi:Uncharacterised protein [Mycobacteroides abscessus subsp. abscessus]|nr:Uncharacterised protein [Mycobacteroides abscessus subsp. abscessus]